MFSSKTASASVPSLSLPFFPSRIVYRIIIIVWILMVLQAFHLHYSYPGWTVGWNQPSATHSDCDPEISSALDDVLVIMKTGANEAPDKLPVHFATTLRCVPHYVVYSDLNETIAGHDVYDALDEINPEIRMTHPDFRYYQALQDQGRDAFSEEELEKWSMAGNTRQGRDTPGWKLDKWKFLPMAEKAYRQRPDAKWFIFAEADTYILWKNMITWLSKFDASQAKYLGMQMQVQGEIFGYGGAGFVLSNSALRTLVDLLHADRAHWDGFTETHWAGDCVLGQALKSAGISLSFSWPTLVSESPTSLNFNGTFGGKGGFWCHFAATYHHLSPQDIIEFSAFEQEWNNQKYPPMRHQDTFRHFVLPQIGTEREDWDNESETVQSSDSHSPEHCRKICESQQDCMQFSHAGRVCKTGDIVKLGRRQPASAEGQRVVSGWMMDRVHAFMAELDKSCERYEWVIY